MTVRQANAILDDSNDDEDDAGLPLHTAEDLEADLEASNRGIDLRTPAQLKAFKKTLQAERGRALAPLG